MAGERVESARVTVETGDVAFHESDWIGHHLAIGDEVRAYVTFSCPRCVMTTLAQGDVPADPEILKTATANTLMFPLLAKKLPSVGVYATVVRGGTIKPGDAVRVEGTSALRRLGTYANAIKRAIHRR